MIDVGRDTIDFRGESNGIPGEVDEIAVAEAIRHGPPRFGVSMRQAQARLGEGVLRPERGRSLFVVVSEAAGDDPLYCFSVIFSKLPLPSSQ